MIRRWLRRLRAALGSAASERELRDELQFHLDRQTADFIRDGMPAEQARLAARREFGGVEQRRRGGPIGAPQPIAVLGTIGIGFAHDAGHWRLPRSNADVAFARQLDAALPHGQRVAIEQAWPAGARLYLHPRDVVDLDPGRLGDVEYVSRTIPPEAAVVLDTRTRARHGLAAVLHSRGYQRDGLAVRGSRYELWTTRR